MKQFFAILFLGLVFFGCTKKEDDAYTIYEGDWNFEIAYTSELEGVLSETIVKYQGTIQNGNNPSVLELHYCIDCSLMITIDKEGVIRNLNHDLLGVIDSENCLININQPKESSISKISIKGVK